MLGYLSDNAIVIKQNYALFGGTNFLHGKIGLEPSKTTGHINETSISLMGTCHGHFIFICWGLSIHTINNT